MSDVQRAAEVVSGYMEKITKLFKPGVKIAVMVRTPGLPERDFMMTDDDLNELRGMLDRRDKQTRNAMLKELAGE